MTYARFTDKKTYKDELDFIEFIKKSNLSKKNVANEHEIIEELINNSNFEHRNNLLFYHWYERRYKKNIINDKILSGLNKSNKYNSKRTLQDEIIDKSTEFMTCGRFLDYTVYYEYYYDFFPKIEEFSYEQFKGAEMLQYILELFPQIIKIDYKSKFTFFRFSKNELKKLPYDYNSFTINYKPNNLLSFYPHRLREIHTYNPHSLMIKGKKDIANLVREEKGLPKIGEGWISETLLYYEVKNALQDYEVVHHGSPNWLGLQHLDIYIPSLNIGIEYQGKQHVEPVPFFGGLEAFNKNLERDERKKRLCYENGLVLFYVYPETDTNKFLFELKNYIEKI